MDKYFVIGPSTQIGHGIVGETEMARWKDYVLREGQPPLKVAADARSTLRAERVLPPQDPETDIEFLLELFEPEFEFEDPGPVTWLSEYRRMLTDAIHDEPEIERERRLIGPREWAGDLVKSLAGSLPEVSSEGTMLGKLRIDPEDSGHRSASLTWRESLCLRSRLPAVEVPFRILGL